MFRGLVPLPIELPLSSSDTPPQQVGFLLSSCGITVALTSEACLKGLPKSSTGEIAKLKGWPRLQWFVTEHLPKPPKDFAVGTLRVEDTSTAYIEYTTDKEGSVMGNVKILVIKLFLKNFNTLLLAFLSDSKKVLILKSLLID